MRQARFWEPEGRGTGAVRCGLCSHRCSIRDGGHGVCGVRWNRGGTLYTAAFGKVIARHVDPIEKKPLYHFLPGSRSYSIATPGCNFRCAFCQNWQISQFRARGPEVPGEPLTAEEAVSEALRAGCRSVSYTYTEPTVFFEYAEEIGRTARARGLKNVFVTNGYQTPEAVAAMAEFVDAANVDLKSFRDAFYRSTCQARLEPVLESIRGMAKAGIHVEVTTLLVTGENDSDEELRDAAAFLASVSPDLPWHVSRFHPDYKLLDREPTPVERLRRAAEIGGEAGLRYVYVGNVPGLDQDTRCPSCGRVVVKRLYMGVDSMDLPGGRCPGCGAPVPILL
ncbi:MAG: AmmeMemoRadiSam system radical SAM enzyme [Planctomycetes bacterium]|nr:AmmeMemoRadiSam system radical SAM enzyme [Planctomycetota bacterium]